jgi:predicted AlkP superfamily phosphohydrolase/phosphomutase
VPALSAAFSGARAALAAEDTRDPARAWTTIATGRPPDVHGVHGLETRRLTGVQGSVPLAAPSGAARAVQAATDLLRLTRPSIASGAERRVKTLWEVAADSGLRTVVVNWWATWPAPAQGSATILSDRSALRLELGGALDAEIAPPAVYERLRAEWSDLRQRAAGRAQPLNEGADATIADVVRRSAELDALQLTLAERVQGSEPDLLAIYLPGLDIAQHSLFGERTSTLGPSAVAARVEAVRAYYRFLDRLLVGALAPDPNELVFVVAGPGRLSARSPGALAMRGVAAHGDARADARVTDVMPTILYALGLPHSRELPGRPLQELFVSDYAAKYPVREIATYGRPSSPTGPRSGQPLDEEMIERLRSLGYVR